MRKYFTTFFLSATLCLPVILPLAGHAQDRDDHHEEHRYYDAQHKDYHNWNNDEDRAWRHWLEVNHMEYHDWARANRREQQRYWKWRHEHKDWH